MGSLQELSNESAFEKKMRPVAAMQKSNAAREAQGQPAVGKYKIVYPFDTPQWNGDKQEVIAAQAPSDGLGAIGNFMRQSAAQARTSDYGQMVPGDRGAPAKPIRENTNIQRFAPEPIRENTNIQRFAPEPIRENTNIQRFATAAVANSPAAVANSPAAEPTSLIDYARDSKAMARSMGVDNPLVLQRGDYAEQGGIVAGKNKKGQMTMVGMGNADVQAREDARVANNTARANAGSRMRDALLEQQSLNPGATLRNFAYSQEATKEGIASAKAAKPAKVGKLEKIEETDAIGNKRITGFYNDTTGEMLDRFGNPAQKPALPKGVTREKAILDAKARIESYPHNKQSVLDLLKSWGIEDHKLE